MALDDIDYVHRGEIPVSRYCGSGQRARVARRDHCRTPQPAPMVRASDFVVGSSRAYSMSPAHSPESSARQIRPRGGGSASDHSRLGPLTFRHSGGMTGALGATSMSLELRILEDHVSTILTTVDFGASERRPHLLDSIGRGGEIRTHDPLRPRRFSATCRTNAFSIASIPSGCELRIERCGVEWNTKALAIYIFNYINHQSKGRMYSHCPLTHVF
jgi:hypothetical protein